MEREHLDILYQIIATLGRAEIRKVIAHGTSLTEILEATNALAKETENDTLFVPEDFEDALPG